MGTNKLVGIQYLRATAAIMVVAYLAGHFSSPWFKSADRTLFSGVDIFFVISGFIMVVTSRRMAPGEFIKRRIIRIVPLYWILTLGVFALKWLQHDHDTAEHLAKSLLFVPYMDVAPREGMFPVIDPGWSLNLEMFFYALFAITLVSAIRKWSLAILGVMYLSLVALGVSFGSAIASFYMQYRLIEFGKAC